MGEMTVARNLRNLPPNDFQVPDLCGFARLIQNQFAPANGCAAHVVFPRFGPAQINGIDGICGIGIRSEHDRSEEHTSELQSLMSISYAVFCLKKKILRKQIKTT